MDILFSFISGSIIKIYDDFTDNNVNLTDFQLNFLKVLQTISLVIISIKDFNFSLFFYIMNVLSFIQDNDLYLKDNYQKSISLLYPIFIFLSFSHRTPLNIISILYISCFLVFFALEPKLTPEEYSHRKFIIRTITTVVVFIGLFVGYYLNVSWSFLKIGTICLGYILTSCIFQLYMLSQDNDRILQALVLHT